MKTDAPAPTTLDRHPVLAFEVEGAPVPKARPRFRILRLHGGRMIPQTYTPASTKTWEAQTEAEAGFAVRACRWTCRPGRPLDVTLRFRLEPPKDHRSKSWGTKAPVGKPDLDNLAKAVLDGMAGAGVWSDDSEIVRLTVSKRWALEGESPGVSVLVVPF